MKEETKYKIWNKHNFIIKNSKSIFDTYEYQCLIIKINNALLNFNKNYALSFFYKIMKET